MSKAPETVQKISADRLEELTHTAGAHVPIEQSAVWDAFDAAIAGRQHWRRLEWSRDGEARAVISLTRHVGRGFVFLWAKHGPVWLRKPTAEDERGLRRALRDYIAATAPEIAFLRLHAASEAPDLRQLLQTVTYDETVVIDLAAGEDAMMAAMNRTGRKKLRRALRDEGFALSEERDISPEDFEELYAIYAETARRDGFGIFPADTYLGMLAALGDSARLWVARRTDDAGTPGRAVSWVISTVYDGVGQDYYGASNGEGLETNAALRLKWHILTSLGAEGAHTYDLMGVGSERSPQLMGVRQFKEQFGDAVACDAAWDVPVKPVRYRLLTLALAAKRSLRL